MRENRRTFIKAAAAVATSQFPILGANDRVRMGVIGIGGRGRDHIKFLGELSSEAGVAGICDVNQAARERAVAQVENLGQPKPSEYSDMRAMFDDREIDAVSVATPNHWHALATIWACQAGKDVYVEKPACHNVFEGHQMVAAARKYDRVVQVGSQSRSIEQRQQAIAALEAGEIGEVYKARALCFRPRKSIGHTPDKPVPAGLDWSMFLGPAQMKPYSENKFDYNWHWFWDTGNGDIGNQGVHEMDIALWGLGRTGWPKTASSTGGKYVWQDDQETPNTQQAVLEFDGAELVFDCRNLHTPPEGGAPVKDSSYYVAVIFFGSDGFLVSDWQGFQIYLGAKQELAREVKATGDEYSATPHFANFLEAVKQRDHTHLNADVAVGVAAANQCHLTNIAYRVKRTLNVVRSTGRFAGDAEANGMLTRNYRAPYVVPVIGPA